MIAQRHVAMLIRFNDWILTVKKYVFLWLLMMTSITWGSTIVVNTARTDLAPADDGLCQLSEAIAAANTNLASGSLPGECVAGQGHPVVDVIEFEVSILPAYFAVFEEYTLTESLYIKGSAKELVTFTGIGLSRMFHLINTVVDAEFTFTDLTFADFVIRRPFDDYGGAVLASLSSGASLTFERVNFIGNNSEQGGGALGLFGGSDNSTTIRDCLFEGNFVLAHDQVVAGGGAIFIGANQTVLIQNSTFSNNSATTLLGSNPLDDSAGGAILMRANGAAFTSELTIEHSTFTGNKADGVGGALAFGGPAFAADSSVVTIKHSTITANQADFNADQTGPDSGGGGFYSSSTQAANLFNSIIADNSDQAASAAADLTGAIVSIGYNLIGNNSSASFAFPAGQPNINQDWVGDANQVIDPLLEPLADNGGPTPTRLLQHNSTAVDQGKCNVVTADQRHQHNDQTQLRTIDQAGISNALTGCDIGAVELGGSNNNPLPMLQADSYTLLEGQTLMVLAKQGLLSNDSDNDDLMVISAGVFNSDPSTTSGEVELLANGQFVFAADDAEAFGTTGFTYTVSDGFNHDTASVTLTTMAVNDAPSFTASSTQIVADPGVSTRFPNWAQNISPGPANEASQNMAFVVKIIDLPAGFFASLPSIDPSTGDLSLQLTAAATGTVQINVTLLDDGGTDHGGESSSVPTMVTITSNDVLFKNGFD